MIDWVHVLEVIIPTVFVGGVAWGTLRTGLRADIKSVRDELRQHRVATDAWRGHMDDQIQLIFDKLIPDRTPK